MKDLSSYGIIWIIVVLKFGSNFKVVNPFTITVLYLSRILYISSKMFFLKHSALSPLNKAISTLQKSYVSKLQYYKQICAWQRHNKVK